MVVNVEKTNKAELGTILGAKAMIEIIGLLTPSHD